MADAACMGHFLEVYMGNAHDPKRCEGKEKRQRHKNAPVDTAEPDAIEKNEGTRAKADAVSGEKHAAPSAGKHAENKRGKHANV